MAYVTVPKDLTKIKSKVMFNLTKRQLLCFGAAVAIGLPLFFLTKDSAGTTTAALCMVLAMLPMFLLAMYEKNGQPLEVIIRQFVEVKFLRPKERPYQTNNFYAALARQEQLDTRNRRRSSRKINRKSIKRIWRFDSMNTRFTIEEENIVAIYAEDSRETTLENILAAMPYMDEDMRQLAAAAVNKLQAMTDSEFSEREFILTDEE